MGLVRIAPEQSEALAEWRVAATAADPEAQTWPRYMVFSLFGERGTELDLAGELRSWRDGLRTKEEPGGAEEPALPGFLRHYQEQGVRWMAHLRARSCHGLLADEMGLGKTLQVLSLLQAYPAEGRPSLVVCPASVVPVWKAEAANWYPGMRVEVLRSGFDFASEPDPGIVWVASYTQLRRNRHLLGDTTFGYAVLDEAQQIKNPDAKVTHACCAIRAESRFALTGTPLENRLLDLWTLFRFLMPGLLSSRLRFEEAATDEDAERRRLFGRRLRHQIAPFILRRKKDAVGGELPPKQEIDLVCPITDLQRRVYENLLEEGRRELGDDLQQAMHDEAMSFFALLTRLRQACCDPGLLPGVEASLQDSGKAATLLNRLEGVLAGNGGRKVVVFSQFVQLLRRIKPALKKAFPGATLFELTGETRDRAKPVKEFQETRGPALILVSLRAGGTGITLHAADYVFLLDPWWNPAVESQAVDRVHRIGQDKHVFVYRMITRGTIEERIQHLKREKRELFENTLGSLGTAADLREHFADLEELARLLPAGGVQHEEPGA
jgi:SNF2 family DNA or RNA helicase